MHPLDLTVRCMSWVEGGRGVAVCLDFTLAAQGATQDEARGRLHAQIVDYVTQALSIDAAHAHALLARRAPLRDRLRFAFWHAVANRPRVRYMALQAGLRVR